MHFIDREPMDIPQPPTVDIAAEMIGAPVIGFLAQPSLTELGVGTVSSSTNGGPLAPESVAISYTLWRNPTDHDDPANLVDVGEEQSLEQEPSKPLPEWIQEFRKLARYPSLWEAVTTTRVLDTQWRATTFCTSPFLSRHGLNRRIHDLSSSGRIVLLVARRPDLCAKLLHDFQLVHGSQISAGFCATKS